MSTPSWLVAKPIAHRGLHDKANGILENTLSAAEAISVITNGIALATHFGDGVIRAGDVAAGLHGAVVKDPVQDRIIWQEYLEAVVRERKPWGDLYRACRELV